MKKAVLFIGYDSPVEAEIGEYLQDKTSEAFFASSNEHAIRLMDDVRFSTVVLNLRSLNDAVILRYVNRYHPDIEVVVSADKEFDEVIEIFNQSRYTKLPKPFRLDELGSKL